MIIDKVWESTNDDDREELAGIIKKRQEVQKQFDEYDKHEPPSIERLR